MDSDLFPIKVAAKKLGISINTLRRMCDRGEIAHYRVGSHRRFSDHYINEYLLKRVCDANCG